MFRSMARSLPFVLLAACASEDGISTGDLGDLEGIEEAGQALTDLSGRCSVATTTVTIELQDNDVALIGRSADGKFTINGYQCGTLSGSAVRRVDIKPVAGTTGANTVILDYLNGTFAAGVTGQAGVTVDLGAGADSFKMRGSKAADSWIFGGDGATKSITINGDAFVDVTVTGAEEFTVALGDGNDVFSAAGSVPTGNPFSLPVTIHGGGGNDTIRGGAGADFYFGGPGNDTFQGGATIDGADEINGGDGTDTMDYGLRAVGLVVTVDGTDNDGEDTDADGTADEADNVGLDVEVLKGSKVADTLTGQDDDDLVDTIYGGEGNDTIAGLGGDDLLYGDAGDDLFAEGEDPNGGDVFNGGLGVDTVSYAEREDGVTVIIDALANDGDTATNEGDKVMLDVENVTGGEGDDVITGSPLANVLIGGDGVDTLTGGEGADSLTGGEGNDILNGGGGNDTFLEGDEENGNDTMNGNAGIDTVDYSLRTNDLEVVIGTDNISGEGAEADSVKSDVENVLGGEGADEITGSDVDNVLTGGEGDDVLNGGKGKDTLTGGAGQDELNGGEGDDVCDGGDDDDEVNGDDGADQLDGGAGDDTITGGAGDDLIDGGDGDDTVDCGAGESDVLLDLTATNPVACEL